MNLIHWPTDWFSNSRQWERIIKVVQVKRIAALGPTTDSTVFSPASPRPCLLISTSGCGRVRQVLRERNEERRKMGNVDGEEQREWVRARQPSGRSQSHCQFIRLITETKLAFFCSRWPPSNIRGYITGSRPYTTAARWDYRIILTHFGPRNKRLLIWRRWYSPRIRNLRTVHNKNKQNPEMTSRPAPRAK